ncbi:MAG TPA: pyridoxal phosphate-dependent aminotransferase [Thermoanaerobaculia bacterium]|nr:pyridoxal phosphate-dependent aminotransferase [Thermoanaerobaculia bacterium]
MRLADRMTRVEESATLRLSRRVAELRASGADLVDLGAGEPDFPSPQVAVEAVARALRDGHTKYTEVGGLPALRGALADRFRALGAPWGPVDGLITVGAKAALFEVALALVQPGDEVVVPSPCWVSIPDQARLAGAEPVFVPTAAADGFAIRAEPILAALSPRTRAVVINSPCNPTGGLIAAKELERVVEECSRRGVAVVSDETYDRFVWDGRTHASIAALACDYPQTVVLVGSFSKTFAMTGWRIGYVFAPKAILAAVRTVQSHVTSNVTTFAMHGALAALEHGEAEVQERLLEYQARRDLLSSGLGGLPGFGLVAPAGTFYAFPDCSGSFRPGLEGSVAFAEYLLESAGVVVVPGSAFGDDRHLRLSFAASRATIAEALERMRAAVEPAVLDERAAASGAPADAVGDRR